MKYLTAILIFLASMMFNHSLKAQSPQWMWVQQEANGFVEDIAVDGMGNTLVTGWFEGTATFGDTTLNSMGDGEIFVAKYDANGNWLWALQAGGTGEDEAHDIVVDGSGNNLVTGSFSDIAFFGNTTLITAGGKDIFIAKYDANGNWLWAEKAGGAEEDEGNGIAVDGSGNTLITGVFGGTATFGDTTLTTGGTIGTLADIFVAKYDANANFLWARQAGDSAAGSIVDAFQAGFDIAVDGSGNGLVTGSFDGPTTFGDTTLSGTTGRPAMFVAKYSTHGNLLWANQADAFFADYIKNSITVDGSGNSLVTGAFRYTATFGDTTLTSLNDTYDIFIAKYDANGNWLWVQQAGGAGFLADLGRDITVDASGNCLVTGDFNETAIFGDTSLTSAGGREIFVAKYDANGNFLWVEQAGGIGDDEGYGIAVDGSGHSLVAGSFSSDATFGDTTLTASGLGDIFIAKIGEGITGIKPVSAMSTKFRLNQNYPNPFNPATTINYRLPKSAQVELTIFNLLGQKVKTLVKAFQTAGEKSVVWDGTNAAGEQVGSGIYFYHLQARQVGSSTGDFIQARKMLLAR